MVISGLKDIIEKHSVESLAIFVALYGYVIQAFVGVNNIVATPLFFFLLGVGLSLPQRSLPQKCNNINFSRLIRKNKVK